MDKDNVTETKNILEWYGSKREKVLRAFTGFATFIFLVFLFGIFFDVDAGFITGKPSMPEFDIFYKESISDIISKANVIDLVLAAVFLFLFKYIKVDVKGNQVRGVWLYNIILIGEALFLGKHLVVDLIFFGRFPFLGIIYVALILSAVFVAILNYIHYRNNKDAYVDSVEDGGIVVCIVMAVLTIVISAVGIKEVVADVRVKEDEYAAYVYRDTYEVLRVAGDSSINERSQAYITLQFVSLFNDRGRIYTPEEMDEAIYNLVYYGGNSYYCGDSWYPIIEFNKDLDDIEEKYDFSQYSYKDSVEPDYFVFNILVTRRLECLGQRGGDFYEEFNKEEVDAACKYVYDFLLTGKPIEEIGEDGEEIVITIPDKVGAGEAGYYDIDTNYENAYATIVYWGKVDNGETTETFSSAEKEEFTFEEGCTYMAKINIYPELTYCFNDNMKIVVEGLECDEISFEYDENWAAGPFYSGFLWVTIEE
ncbi:MAG: hypothetical protein E7259_09575 [Lachnospiraceae bacterium]|nr:hypothetical protein [Lachnospiraceae bacterium]